MKFEKIKTILDEALIKYQVPCSDIIISKDKEIVYRYMNGSSDQEKGTPLQGNELYYLYSASKLITCTAALQLVELGKLALDDCVSKYIPEYAHVKVRTPQGPVPVKTPLTIRHLFTMTSGFDYNFFETAIKAQLRQNPNASTLDLVRSFAEKPLLFEPGTHFMYGLSHDILAAIIEVVSGMSYGEYIQKHIFDVCDMKNTYVGCPESMKDRMCTQYQYQPATDSMVVIEKRNPFILTPNYQSGGAGLVSCADDYIKFAQAIVSGERLLKRETIDLWRAGHIEGDALLDFQEMKPGYSYGLGVRTNLSGNFSAKGEFGWDGAAGAYVLLDPDNHLAVFFITHVKGYSSYLHGVLHPMLRDAVYRCVAK